jgi:DNA polymerase-4
MKRYGVEGRRLWRLSRGIDNRSVNPERETKSVSAETTFGEDIASFKPLEKILWSLCEKVSARLKSSGLAGGTVQLKLKTDDFRLRTRARSLGEPTQLAARIFAAGKDLLAREIDGTRFRLLGIGVSNIDLGEKADTEDLIDLKATRTKHAEHAIDKVRKKFGKAAVVKGLVFEGEIDDEEDEESTSSRPR